MGRRPDPAAVKAKKAPVRSQRKPIVQASEGVEQERAAPKWLKGQGLAIWRERAPVLRQQRLLQAADELAFARYCRNFALWMELRKNLDKVGYTYDASTTHGGTLRRADPSFLIADRLERQMLATEDRFGLNPAMRQRLIMQRAAGAGGQAQLPLDDQRKANDAAATPAEPAQPIGSPIGMLN